MTERQFPAFGTFTAEGEALAISKPLDRDRAVDESGVFGRRGARPFNSEEMMRMLRTKDGAGELFRVSDNPLTMPVSGKP